MKGPLLAVLFIAGARLLPGQDAAITTLVSPADPVAPGAPVRVALVGFNPTAGDTPFNAPVCSTGLHCGPAGGPGVCLDRATYPEVTMHPR